MLLPIVQEPIRETCPVMDQLLWGSSSEVNEANYPL
jgi:hypothetical protein